MAAGLAGGNGRADAELAELRQLLLGPERRRLDELTRRLDALGATAEELAELLPEAIALRSGRDRQLARALAPTVERAIQESVRRNPRDIATAIFPVLGPAIRKAIAEAMAGLVRSINTAVEHSLSLQGLRWRIEGWRTGVPYAQLIIRHALVYRVEQVFLIHADTGLLLAHVSLPTLATPDADLISGMLTAIQDFVRDSFRTEVGGTLRTFSVGELTVQVEQGPGAVIAAVIRGQAPDAVLQRLQDTLEVVHLRFASELGDFAGDAAQFEAAKPLLNECLETVLKQDQRTQRSGRAWMVWVGPLTVIAVILAVVLIRAEVRWDRAVTRLRAEPGIVVLSADREWGRWRLGGLRDPLAADPRNVLAGLGANPAVIDANFQPYLSLDPALVLARARQTLAVPAEVTATLRGDTLVLGGSAPMGWLGRLSARAPNLPGVVRVEVDSVRPILPAAVAAIAREIEAERALFDVGSAQVTAGAADRLAVVAAGFRRLQAEAAAPGFRIELELVGRTDPTGTDAANQALSQWRVDAASRRLVALGVAATALRGAAVATSSPLSATDPEEQARLNRSVSFSVRVGPVREPEAPR